MVLISRDPPVFLSRVRGEPAENRFSNHNEVYNLLVDCYLAFKERRFPRLIELCGTSDALEALVAAHDEDNMYLYVLSRRESWDKVLARIKQLPPAAAVAELFGVDVWGGPRFRCRSSAVSWGGAGEHAPSEQAGRQEAKHPGHRHQRILSHSPPLC